MAQASDANTACRTIRSQIRLILVSIVFATVGTGPAFAEDRHPLQGVDLSSPRATIDALVTNIDEAWTMVRDEYEGGQRAQARREIFAAVGRAGRTLDLSEIAPSAQREAGLDALVYLYEIFARIEMPPREQIPDAEYFSEFPAPARWTIPHTEITIERKQDGPQAGTFVFTPATVARAGEFYRKVSSLPYRHKVPIEDSVGFRQNLPGHWIPIPLVESFPDWARGVFLGQAVWKIVASVISLIVFLGVIAMVHRASRKGHGGHSPIAYLKRLAVPVGILILVPLWGYVVIDQINLISVLARNLSIVLSGIVFVIATWAAWLACLFIAEIIIATPRIEEDSLNAQLLRLSARIAGIILGLTIVFIGANRVGIPIFGVLAGVGVGGLAVALAAQDSLKNLLGSLMIFMDKPYKPGQRIVVQGHDGFVEEIGLRSTRIRLLSGAMTSIPNEKMATFEIENIGQRNLIRRTTSLGLHYETPPDKVELAVDIVKDILEDHEGMLPKLPPRVFFNEFVNGTLNIFVSYWYAPPRRWKVMAFDEKVNMEILRRFDAAGIQLAYPTSAMVLERAEDDKPAIDSGGGPESAST